MQITGLSAGNTIGVHHVPASTPCPPADASDREAAHVVASHPGQGWSLLCNGVVMFEDTGALLPDGLCIPPHRPPWIGGHRHASLDPRPATGKIGAALPERLARSYEEGSLITPGQSARSLMQHLATDASGETWNVNTSRPEE